MKKRKDLIVVGGSFAGLVTATSAAARGVDTVLLERKSEPGEKVRTTGILVKEAADLLDIPSHLGKQIPKVILYAPNGKSITLRSPGYYFLATDTPELLRWFSKRASLVGVEQRFGENASFIQQRSNHILINDMESRFLVGADGARSNVAKNLGLSENQEFLYGVEQEWIGIKGLETDALHVFLDSQLAPGYIAWIVPGPKVFQLGVAVSRPNRPKIHTLLEKFKRYFDFSQATKVGGRGGVIPSGALIKDWYRNRALLLGDAAGMVSPLTAGGIQPAIEMGRAAGIAIHEHIYHNGEHPSKALSRVIPRFQRKQVARKLYETLSPPNWLINHAIGNPLFRAIAQTTFYHNRGLTSPSAWFAFSKAIVGKKDSIC